MICPPCIQTGFKEGIAKAAPEEGMPVRRSPSQGQLPGAAPARDGL